MNNDFIVIKGAKENNLKNVDLTIPRNKLVVFTGVSGSGKSTLAFDTIFAEGQRRYMESLSSYARQFLGQMQKPNVESIEGLSPAISIDQKTTNHNPRSTVGTITEIYDYLRLLFARIGKPYCPHCHKPITTQTIDQIVDKIMEYSIGTKLLIMSPIVRGEKGTQAKTLEHLQKDGIIRVKVDGEVRSFDDGEIKLDKNVKHTIYAIVDRVILKDESRLRINESVESCLKMSDGLVIIEANQIEETFSTRYSCDTCGWSLEEIEPRLFSFNSPFGSCKTCSGLGYVTDIDVNMLMRDKTKSLNQGALDVSGWNFSTGSYVRVYFEALAKKYDIDLNEPIMNISKEKLDKILYGTNGEKLDLGNRWFTKKDADFEGVVNNLKRRYNETTSSYIRSEIFKYMKELPCPECHGKRLNQKALSVLIDGKSIFDICEMSIKELIVYYKNIKLTGNDEAIAQPILKEINARLEFMQNVGLSYLTLSRTAETLSGGESQRIRLASQIGSGLTGVLYILDEPSIGLHQSDNAKLLATLTKLRDLGNTIIVVEHDEDTMRAADYIVDVGPLAGVHGGEIVATGSVQDIISSPRSITGKYLSGERKIEIPKERKSSNKFLEIFGAKEHNLKNINVKVPLGVMTAVTGVSGSGKSSLVDGIIYPALSNSIMRSKLDEGKYDKIVGTNYIDKIINIDQSPIGKTPRSNPATYTGVFDIIRNLFASTLDAKERGYKPGRFSFNVAGGRCEACSGDGYKEIEMYFLPDITVPCEVCKGARYNHETLEVRYKGKNIADILDMTVEKALTFFENIPSIKSKIQALYDVGLGYIKLGQPSTELSGGEAQRIKLASELCRRSTGKTLYILDEPTTGLHMADVDKLVNILSELTAKGNTVVVIEHNLDVIKCADYVIDLGPDGGNQGGKIVAVGTPEQIATIKASKTGEFLAKIL